MTRFAARLVACLVPFATWFATPAALAAPGDWDRSFGTNGRILFQIPGITFSVREWKRQADGKIVIAGHVTDSGTTNELDEYVVARFNANGTPDTGFDADGYLRVDCGSSVIGTAGLELQADGKILLACQAGPDYGDAAVVRLNTNGTRDPTYGTNGEVRVAFAGNFAIANPALKLAPNGDALVLSGFVDSAPSSLTSIALTRLTSTGARATTFGTNGTVFVHGPDHMFGRRLEFTSDGKMVIAGETGPYNATQTVTVVRLGASGEPDTGFGTGGIFTIPFLSTFGEFADMALAANGQIVLAGKRRDSNGYEVPFIARLNANGTLDRDFGSAGRLAHAFGTVRKVLVESDGKIVLAGNVGDESGASYLARLNADGSPDLGFGLRGISRFDFSTGARLTASEIHGLRRNPDGSYESDVAVYDNAQTGYAFARFVATGTNAGVLGIRAEFEAADGGGFYSISEEAPSQKFFVQRTGGHDGTVSVQYRTVSDSAVAGEDFVATTGTVTLNDGETQASFEVPILDDAIPENAQGVPGLEEKFHVELFAPTGGATLSKDRSTLQFSPDFDYGSRLSIVVPEQSAIEGTTVRFALSRRGDLRGPLTTTYTIVPGTATAGSDYTNTSGSVTWPANVGGVREISIPLANDGVAEPTETFTINVAGWPDPLTVRILDDDDAAASPALAFVSSQAIVHENAGTVVLSVRRLGNVTQAASATWGTSSCSGLTAALPAVDYVDSTGSLNWAANDGSSKTITIPLVDDAALEDLESCAVSVTSAVPMSPSFAPNGYFVIEDDDGVPAQAVISLGANASIGESAGNLVIPVTLTGLSVEPVSVSFYVSPETASTNDVQATTGTLTWNAGESGVKNLVVPIYADTRDEIDETFVVSLGSPTAGATFGNYQSRFTILDDDATPAGQAAPVAPGLEVVRTNITAGEDQQSLYLDVRRVGDRTDPLYVSYLPVAGAATSPTDFLAMPAEVRWNANDGSVKRIEIQINGDKQPEPSEGFTINFATTWVSDTGTSTAVPVTILDDDTPALPARVAFVAATQTVAEAATTVTLQVGRTGNTSGASSVDYATASGTAGTADFVATSGTLTWAADDASMKTIAVTLTPDSTDEPDENFTVTLSNPSSGTELDAATATVTITDDDPAPGAGGGSSSSGGSASSGGGKKGGGSESLLGLLALAALLARRHTRHRTRS